MSTRPTSPPLPALPLTAPEHVAGDTWLIPSLVPAGPDTFVPVSSLVIRGAEPVLVDTGAPLHRERWWSMVTSLVDPADVRWVFLSHDDPDHVGNIDLVLEACPNATVVANFFMCERMSVFSPIQLDRVRWLEPGDSFVAGDRRLHAVLPPLFDAPTTRGLYDERTDVLWSADCFAAPTVGAVHRVEDLPAAMYDETFPL